MLEQLGQYKILERIGAGGMGEVYRARDTRLGRTVAIKVLPATVANDPERRERFLQEARATAALSHPNIAALFEVGEDQGQLFLAFEFVPGETLGTVIGGRPLNPRQALDYAIQLCDALADAHAEGIVHRDIKPGNIIITPKDKAKILDFGLATWTQGGAEREQAATILATAAGAVVGTAPYMSPEQALGERVDHRTDIFSLGVVLFEMLTGRLPFIGKTTTAVSLQIVQAAAPAPSAANPSVPREIDPILAKALAKSIDKRYEAAATMAAELRSVAAILDVRDGTSEPVTLPSLGPPKRRPWLLVGLLSLLALAAAAWFERDTLARTWKRTVGRRPVPTIAVVPFETDKNQEFFADGLGDDLITRLGQTPGLKVIGRSATRSYRGRTPREVAQELSAGVVLTGTVRPAGEVVKISLELIDPSDGTVIWTGQYSKEVKDIFAVQAQVADDVAQALRVKLQPTRASERTRSRTVNARAYEAYLRGRQSLAERRIEEAIQHFDAAIAADTGLAEAYAGRAEARHLETAFDGVPETPARRQQLKADAARAAELDPDLPQANLALGLAADSLADALTSMRRSVAADPSFTEGFHQIGDQILDFDPELAIRFYRRSLEIDPRYDVNHIDIVAALTLLDRWDEARRENALLSPSSAAAQGVGLAALIDLDQHRFDQAIERLSAAPPLRRAPPFRQLYVMGLRTAGRGDEAYREAIQLSTAFPPSCETRAVLAGLTLEHRAGAAAHRLADPILETARADTAAAADVRCAALAAAAMNDPQSLGTMLTRVASNEVFLRYWALEVFGVTGRAMLRGRMYPWAGIVDRPAVASARQRLDAAYARKRDEARAIVGDLLESR